MIGLDTNVLVRILVADDARQAERARKFLVERCTPEDPGFVNLIVLCELAWTLDRAYGFKGREIISAVEHLLANATIAVENRTVVEGALRISKAGGAASFPDALIGQMNLASGCEATVTFDRRAARLEGFLAI